MKLIPVILLAVLLGYLIGMTVTRSSTMRIADTWRGIAERWEKQAAESAKQTEDVLALLKTVGKQRDDALTAWRDTTRNLVEA